MATTYNVYRDGEKVASGIEEKTYQDTGLSANTEYEYQVSAENEHGESDLSEVVVVTTDPITVDSQESLKRAIDEASEGDTITIDGGFTLEKDVAINKDIIIDGNNHTIIVDIPESEVQDSGFRVTEGDLSVKNISIELSEGKNRSFLLHSTAGSFSLKDSNIVGGDTSVDGNIGISSATGEGVITIDNVVLSGLRTGFYRNGNQVTEINNTTFENNYRGMTIHGNIVPVLTNNTFTNNDGDISASVDSEIKEEIAQEAENPDNNNTFDGDKPKYNWVTGVTVSPKTNNLEVGGTRTLNATVEPSTAKQDVTWSSDNDEVATVSSDGTVTAIAEGEATITVTAEGKTDTATVNVTEPEPEPEPEPDPEDPKE